jgi:mono/diheme cytochrome c family protein
MKFFLFGFLSAFALIVIVGGTYIALGFAPVATSSAPFPFEKLIAHMALDARISREATGEPPIQPSETVYLAGSNIYKADCAVCHGVPGTQPTAIARGEFPPPPELFRGKGVSDDPAAETYWKVANGIRLTGMPGFSHSLSTDQMWQVSLLLANSDKLSPAVIAALKTGSGQ